MGLIRSSQDQDTICLNHKLSGDKYIKMLSEGVKLESGIKKCFLSENRISDPAAASLIKNFSPSLIELNLSNNKIGK